MNLGSNVSLWISLLPKISNAPQVCCLSASLRGSLSLFIDFESLSILVEYANQSSLCLDERHLATYFA